MNPGLTDHWRTLCPLGQYLSIYIYMCVCVCVCVCVCPSSYPSICLFVKLSLILEDGYSRKIITINHTHSIDSLLLSHPLINAHTHTHTHTHTHIHTHTFTNHLLHRAGPLDGLSVNIESMSTSICCSALNGCVPVHEPIEFITSSPPKPSMSCPSSWYVRRKLSYTCCFEGFSTQKVMVWANNGSLSPVGKCKVLWSI